MTLNDTNSGISRFAAILSSDQLQALDSLNGPTSAPGRVRKYLDDGPDSGRLPASCTLTVLRNGTNTAIAESLAFITRSLKTGSGVKMIFERDFAISPAERKPGKLSMRLNEDHPDYLRFAEMLAANGVAGNSDELRFYASLNVQDSMETQTSPRQSLGSCEAGQAGTRGEVCTGIIDSWRQVLCALAGGFDIEVDLSQLRPIDSAKSDGSKASGPASFGEMYVAIAAYVRAPSIATLLKLYGKLNSVILRGGFKRGIVTSMMHVDCAEFMNYLAVPTAELDGSHKKGAIVTAAAATNSASRAAIVAAVATESIFLQKDAAELPRRYAGTYSNVCVAIQLPDKGTCLIWRVNLGQIRSRQQLIDAYCEVTQRIVSLHIEWRTAVKGTFLEDQWLPIDEDRQVAIDIFGLANMLSSFGWKYDDFVGSLHDFLVAGSVAHSDAAIRRSDESVDLPEWFAAAYEASTQLADKLTYIAGIKKLDRLHCVEPAQSHAFEVQDSAGGTLCRGIWPPFGRIVTRFSENQGSVTVNHGRVETVQEVGAETIFQLNDLWQQLMNCYGRAHGISADHYGSFDEAAFQRWWNSSLITQYYVFGDKVVNQSFARKVVEEIDLEFEEPDEVFIETEEPGQCSVCAE